MKYTILGFQQAKLIEEELKMDDAVTLRVIKDMFSSASMEFKDYEGIRYMWVNYTYLLAQIPIIGSKRNLMYKIENYKNKGLILSKLENVKNDRKGKFAYISPTAKLDSLQDYDLVQNLHNPCANSAQPLMKNLHNKDTSIKDTSIKDIYTFWNTEKIIEHKKLTDKLSTSIKTVLKDYTEEEIIQAIINYKKILTGTDYFFNYRWTLEEFLKRGLEKFLNWEVCSSNFKNKSNNFNPPPSGKANAGAYEEI